MPRHGQRSQGKGLPPKDSLFTPEEKKEIRKRTEEYYARKK